MTTQQFRPRFAAAAAVLGASFAVVLVFVGNRYPPLMAFDRRVVDSWHAAVSGGLWHLFFVGVALVGHPWVVRLMLAGLAAATLLRRDRRTAAWVLTVLIVNDVAWNSVKLLVHRLRPDFPQQVAGYSFPSGHAAEISAGMGVLAVLTLARMRPGTARRALLAAEGFAVLLVGADRVVLGAHYPSDVVGGWLLGAAVVCASVALFGWPGPGGRVVTRTLSASPEVTQRRHRLAVVLNPVRVPDPVAFKSRVAAATAGAGWDFPIWFETTVDDSGGAMAQAAIAAGADLVAVAGGDGTVRVVCDQMAGTGVPVGVIPSGTGNLLARNLGIPLLPDAAVETLLHGRDRAIDIVRLHGDGISPTRFVVMAGLGLDAAIMGDAPAALKKHLGWPAYLLSGVRHLSYPAVRVEIAVDDATPVRRRARTVLIGNVGSLQAGFPLLPNALIDDGRLDVVVIAPRRVAAWPRLIWRVVTRHPRTDEQLDRFTGTSIAVRCESALPRQLDGDPIAPGHDIRAVVEPGCLLVRVPVDR